MVSTLQHSADTSNKYLLVTSFKTTQNEILETAERATNQKFEVKKVDADAWKMEGVEMLQERDFRGIGRFWGWFLFKDGNGHGAPGKDVVVGNELLGLPQEDMEEVIKEIARV